MSVESSSWSIRIRVPRHARRSALSSFCAAQPRRASSVTPKCVRARSPISFSATTICKWIHEPPGREICYLKEHSYVSNRVKDSKESCQAQYGRVYDCLQHNLNKHDASGEHAGACTGSLEDFAKCTKQWGGCSCGAVGSKCDDSQVHEAITSACFLSI